MLVNSGTRPHLLAGQDEDGREHGRIHQAVRQQALGCNRTRPSCAGTISGSRSLPIVSSGLRLLPANQMLSNGPNRDNRRTTLMGTHQSQQ